MTDGHEIAEALERRFAGRTDITTADFEAILFELMAMATLSHCNDLMKRGISIEEVNEDLKSYLPAIEEWRVEMIGRITRKLIDPSAPSYALN